MINSSFNIPWERVNEITKTIDKAGSYLQTLSEFIDWANDNLANLDVEEIAEIYSDFVSNNEHVIEKINKMLQSNKSINSSHLSCFYISPSSNFPK